MGNLPTEQYYTKQEASSIRCIRCGICCTKYQPVLNLEEAHLIADRLKVGWEYFLAEYADQRWPGKQSILIRHSNGACLFLQICPQKMQRLCLVHDCKPACCLEWESGLERADCREGLKTQWGLTLDPSGLIAGSEEKLEVFDRFLQTLRNP